MKDALFVVGAACWLVLMFMTYIGAAWSTAVVIDYFNSILTDAHTNK